MPPQPPSNRNRRRWLAAAVLAGVFLAGFAGGAGEAFLIFQKRVHSAMDAPATGPSPVDRLFARWEEKLADESQLTESERAALHETFTHSLARLKDIRFRTASDLRSLANDAIDQAGANLPPAKAAIVRAALKKRLRPWGLGDAAEPQPSPPQK